MENQTTHKTKSIILCVFIAALFFPFIQQQLNLFKEKPLGGFYDTEPFPAFSDSLFKAGIFQEKFEKATNDNIGFYTSFVRIQNQFNYWVFNVSKTKFVIIGKNNYLFDKSYINGYNGDDFVGKEYIDIQIEKAKVLAHELKKKHIDLIFAFAPGKGSFFPEYIPSKYLQNKNSDSTNYRCYVDACTKNKLNFVDIRNYLFSIKDTIDHPLFSQVGVHWSDYAAFLAIDTIAKKIEQVKRSHLPKFEISKFEYLDTIVNEDRDAEFLLNVFTPLPHFNMAHLKINYSRDSASMKPSAIIVADSYFSTIVRTNIVDSIFSDWSYWLYNKPIEKDRKKPIDFKFEIEKRDVIILLATDGTLNQFPYGFIDRAYELYAPKDKNYIALKNKEFRLYISRTIDNLNESKAWKRQLDKNAKEKGIQKIDEYLNNAIWLYNVKQKELSGN